MFMFLYSYKICERKKTKHLKLNKKCKNSYFLITVVGGSFMFLQWIKSNIFFKNNTMFDVKPKFYVCNSLQLCAHYFLFIKKDYKF